MWKIPRLIILMAVINLAFQFKSSLYGPEFSSSPDPMLLMNLSGGLFCVNHGLYEEP